MYINNKLNQNTNRRKAMKKIKYLILTIISIAFVVGCDMNFMNTPTKQVEIFLSKYQSLDQDVLDDLNKIIDEEQKFNTEQREKYRGIMKKHYQGITYNIKEETVDGNSATVEVEIEVTDFSSILAATNQYLIENPTEFQDENGQYDENKFIDYRLDELKKAKERVKYTLNLNLTKQDKKWKMNSLSPINESKINGTYVYED